MDFIKKVLENNKPYKGIIERLRSIEKFKNKINSKLKQGNKDELTALSTISEFIFLNKLVDIFGDKVEYERKILFKEPDFFIEYNKQIIIGDFKRIQKSNELMLSKIEIYKNGFDLVESLDYEPELYRNKVSNDIISKLSKYNEIIIDKKAPFIILLDMRSLYYTIAIEHICCFMRLSNVDNIYYFEKNKYSEVLAAVIFLDVWGEYLFVLNPDSKFQLNNENLTLFLNNFYKL